MTGGPQYEATTILPGAPGVPTIIVRDRGAWEAQVAAEKRAKADEQIRAAAADIQRGEQVRKYARRPSLAEQKRALDRIEAEYRHKREEPARAAAQLAELEAWAETAQLHCRRIRRSRCGTASRCPRRSWLMSAISWPGSPSRPGRPWRPGVARARPAAPGASTRACSGEGVGR